MVACMLFHRKMFRSVAILEYSLQPPPNLQVNFVSITPRSPMQGTEMCSVLPAGQDS
jgi:hypothetical protein